jgi:hypothetical protein
MLATELRVDVGLIRYFAMVQQNITKTLRNDSLKPLHRLRRWFDIQCDSLKQADFRNGCLIGKPNRNIGEFRCLLTTSG